MYKQSRRHAVDSDFSLPHDMPMPVHASPMRPSASHAGVSTYGTTVSSRHGSATTQFQEQPRAHVQVAAPAPEPHTSVEQYWAARAVTAESLLSAKTAHHEELKRIVQAEDIRRERQLRHVRAESMERQERLEKLLILLVGFVFVLGAGLVYVLLDSPNIPPPSSWIPSHITIPVLSPFASVVENETSSFNPRVLIAALPFVAVLSYMLFKHYQASQDHDEVPKRRGERDVVPKRRGERDEVPKRRSERDEVMMRRAEHDEVMMRRGEHDEVPMRRGERDEVLMRRGEREEVMMRRGERDEVMMRRGDREEVLMRRGDHDEVMMRRPERDEVPNRRIRR